ncbi:hypothetical protein LXA47_31275 [Massilia sp. P8910]|uniref:hypothetical protein n=1 Tax=Massilia antarctica TaxID=2765360 RepID=UPI001E3873D0|nr:hypothetical protein [Massilia antarctica]MCE3608053.1 hypothetical protein [Massilia antarctica]
MKIERNAQGVIQITIDVGDYDLASLEAKSTFKDRVEDGVVVGHDCTGSTWVMTLEKKGAKPIIAARLEDIAAPDVEAKERQVIDLGTVDAPPMTAEQWAAIDAQTMARDHGCGCHIDEDCQ